MEDKTTRDLGKYVARGRVNMAKDVPPKRVPVTMVQPMCEACGVRAKDVKDVKLGFFLTYSRRLCPSCAWGAAS